MGAEVLTDKVKLYLGDVSLTQLESLVKGIHPESKIVCRGVAFSYVRRAPYQVRGTSKREKRTCSK